AAGAIDLRPLVLLPGMVDLHAHLPQLPNAGLGAGLDLLTWLERYIFPIEQGWSDPEHAARISASAFRAFAAAEAHGIRAILGKVMMDRITYDDRIDRSTILERSLRESEELCARWHGVDD